MLTNSRKGIADYLSDTEWRVSVTLKSVNRIGYPRFPEALIADS